MNEQVIRKVITNFQEGKFTRYGELAKLVDCNPRQVESLFCDADELCKANGQPPISSLVVNENGICGDGYFKFHFPCDKRDKLIIWQEQIAKMNLLDLKIIFKDCL
jgi:hypothetical protein